MKKVILVLFLFLLLAVFAAGIFLMTLDVDRFRPQIVGQIENAIRKPVRLERIKLGWRSGLALDLQGFAVLESEQSPNALLRVHSAKALLKFEPLLRREIQVASIDIEGPSVRLVKRADGSFEGMEIPAEAQPAGTPSREQTATKPAAALPFLINAIRISDGEAFFRDESLKEPLEVVVRKISVDLKDIAFDRPVDVVAQAAFLSGKKNLDLKGRFVFSPGKNSFIAEKFRAALDLAPMDYSQILKASPGLSDSGLVPPLQGVLTADLSRLEVDPQGVRLDPLKIHMEQGQLRLKTLKGPIRDITFEATVTAAQVVLQTFSAQTAGGKIEGGGTADLSSPQIPRVSFSVRAGGLRIEELILPAQSGPQVRGLLSANAKGNLAGTMPEQILGSLVSEGEVGVEQGVVTDLNVLREIFQRLSIIPGLVERLLARLPENYSKKLEANDTKLNPVTMPFLVKEGTVFLPRLDVATDSFQMTGSTTYGLRQGAVNGEAVLAIEPDLSAAMIRSVEELQYLTNERKEIRVPLTFRGNVPQMAVMPDLTFVASTIASKKANEVIGGLLQKALGGDKTPAQENAPVQENASATPAAGEPPAETAQPKSSGLLGELLRRGVEELGSREQTASEANTAS
ncbi:MAG: AsmA family protein [Candidatus Omnitrophica bacterium]|nr:AsmA family protein [Candidatus Omnitrophota bacterium]